MQEEESHTGKTKGVEYTQGADRFDNFRRIGAELNVSPYAVLWIYLKKHLDSIANYIRASSSSLCPTLSEPIESRIMDARVYLALLRGMIAEDRKGGSHAQGIESGSGQSA